MLIEIRDEGNEDVAIYCRIRGTTPMERVLASFCAHFNTPRDKFTFYFRDVQLDPHKTAMTLGMQSGDQVVACRQHSAAKSKDNKGHLQSGDPGGKVDKRDERILFTVNKLGSPDDMLFYINIHTPMLKLKQRFCQRCGVPLGAYLFVFHSVEILDVHTAADLQLRTGDHINAILK